MSERVRLGEGGGECECCVCLTFEELPHGERACEGRSAPTRFHVTTNYLEVHSIHCSYLEVLRYGVGTGPIDSTESIGY